ncbi:hypothetical protein [Williamsia maris]|uniref:Uncharacterized protein n=1 Tax=Williamsia maris TaxID=72806 RepID=A0ABT1HEC2_9NOCA|nr:hypothetical protein [Williamsia maris]MCP2176539.1 hypothetical protein [Williamsia maris]
MSPDQPQRPARPARPQIAVTPMREPVSDDRPRIVDVGVIAWVLTVIALAATSALVAIRQSEVRAELTRSLAADNASASADEVKTAVDIAMIAAGAIALVIVLLALYGCIRIRDRVPGGRTTLTTVGGVTVVGSIAFWTVVEPARDLMSPVVGWSPFVVAALAAIATGVMFVPSVGRWLRAAPKR